LKTHFWMISGSLKKSGRKLKIPESNENENTTH
jgi:hypothetical protein